MMLETDAGMAVDLGLVQPKVLIAETVAGIADTTVGITETDAGIGETADGNVETWPGTDDSIGNSAARESLSPEKTGNQ